MNNCNKSLEALETTFYLRSRVAAPPVVAPPVVAPPVVVRQPVVVAQPVVVRQPVVVVLVTP